MNVVNEKLERFSHEIMTDVESKRKVLLDEAEKYYNEQYDKKETEYLSKAYNIIQNGLKNIDKEKHEIISKAIMDNKSRLLNKRTELINKVFEEVRERLREYTKTEEYLNSLINMIQKGLEEAEDGEKIIYINYIDEVHLTTIKEKFNCTVQVEDKKVDMIGGYKLFNKDKNIFIDESFSTRLEDQKELFLQTCKMNISL